MYSPQAAFLSGKTQWVGSLSTLNKGVQLASYYGCGSCIGETKIIFLNRKLQLLNGL